MPLSVDINQAILALADALDLVGIDETGHGKRVGYMAFVCANRLAMDKPARERLFNIGLLHDIGVSSSREHTHLVDELQWEGAQDHADEGARLLGNFAPLADFSAALRYHHTPWSLLAANPDIDPETRRDANLVFLVDRVDALSAPHYGVDLLESIPGTCARISALAGSLFDPRLVELFLGVANSDAFWMMLEPPHLDRFLFDMQRRCEPAPLPPGRLRELAGLFAYVVDAKSPFTAQHSSGVANLAAHLARKAGLSQEQVEKIEIAGLLHDIGKLRIPDEILEKPGPLSDRERRLMHRHSFETYQVLRRIEGLSEIALWAAYHHETTDGMGYPFGRAGDDLSLEARIIAVSDIFQALAQRRPYRKPRATADILTYLQRLVEVGKLDRQVVGWVAGDLAGCLGAALAERPAARS